MHKDMDADALRDAVVPAQPIEHLVALLQNEKVMMRRLRQDTDETKEELLRLESACKEEDKALAKTMGELQHSDAQRRHLLEQLETSQNQLVELRSEYDMLQRESFVLQHEQNKYASEAQFLQVLLEEYQRDSQAIEQSIGLLEDATFGLEGQSRALAQATQNLENQVHLESSGLEKDQLELQAVCQAVESMRGAQKDAPGIAGGFDENLQSSGDLDVRASGLGRHHWSSGMSLLDHRTPGTGLAFVREGV